MTDKGYNNFMKVILIVAALLAVVTALYLGGDMQKSCLIVKIMLTVILIAVLILIGVLTGISIWCFPKEKTHTNLEQFMCTEYSSGAVRIHKDYGEKSLSIMHYGTLANALSNSTDGDTIYVFDASCKMTEDDLYVLNDRLAGKSKVTVEFIKTSSIVTIKSRKKKE